VTANNAPTVRKGEYYRAELNVANSNVVWLSITNVAVLNNGTNADTIATNLGNILLAATPETFTNDLDGNLIRDGLWTNVWDAENRLIRTENLTSVPTAARMGEEWSYLPDGRWHQRIVSTNNGSTWVASYTNHYLWDGKVLLAVLDHTNGLVASFMRGTDLSGTEQGGGVGGLLAVSFDKNATHFATYDGNGNVVALVNATNGVTSAAYEYDPFGQPTRITGPVAKLNPIRFSTQYADDVAGNLKYFYRDYSPGLARWLSRDPIENSGEKNPYCYVLNDSIGNTDTLGLLKGKFGPQLILEQGDSFFTKFPIMILSHTCKAATAGGCCYLQFVYNEAVVTSIPPRDAALWSKKLTFFDPILNASWALDSSYESRRKAILDHEQRHINDMEQNYIDNAYLLFELEAGVWRDRAACEAGATKAKAAVVASEIAAEKATNARYD
jgi:RHS repeat-associated protein